MREEAIARVMQLVKPTSRRKDCVRQVIYSIELIARPISDLVPRGVVKKQLHQLATALNNARVAIKNIPKEWDDYIYQETAPDVFVRHLLQIEHASKQLAERMNVKRSGGAARAREEAKRARIAAERAFDLLNDWGGQSPTLTKSGPYLRLASLLFELATGQQEKNMNRACTNYFEELRKDGFPNAVELRRMRKGWKQEPPPPDHVLARINSKKPANRKK
jgi:hypothetical protein